MQLTAQAGLPHDGTAGALAARVWRPDVDGPSIVALRGDDVIDITTSFRAPAYALMAKYAFRKKMNSRRRRLVPLRVLNLSAHGKTLANGDSQFGARRPSTQISH